MPALPVRGQGGQPGRDDLAPAVAAPFALVGDGVRVGLGVRIGAERPGGPRYPAQPGQPGGLSLLTDAVEFERGLQRGVGRGAGGC